MKSILSTFTFVLVFSLSFFLRSTPALATTCCSEGKYVDNGFALKGCCKPYSSCASSLDYDSSKYQCGIYACDSSNQQCTQSPIISDPICPSGFGEINPEYIRQKCNLPSLACCKKGIQYPGQCIYNDGSPVPFFDFNFRGCDQIQFTNKTCPDSTTKLNADNKCEKFTESSWDLKKTCLDGKGVETGIGCIPTDNLTDFLKFVLRWTFFASGGIIALMVIATGYTLLTSQGNPEKLQAAKENIVALFSGLILIVFSLVLLQTIGADVLKLPTFTP